MPSPNSPIQAAHHFRTLQRWLEMEGEAERDRLEARRAIQSSERAEQGGETLLEMVIRTHTTGLGGRWLLTIGKRRSPDRLPWHRFKVGSPVILSSDAGGRPIPGVISARRQDSLEVAVSDFPDGDTFRIDLSPDEVTRKRQLAAMERAEEATGRAGQLRDLLLYDRIPRFDVVSSDSPAAHLNASQQDAVDFAMSAQDLAIVHGPPGTGKTTTLVELICRAVKNGERVLACAPSNTAVDNIVERLVACGQSPVRLGHPARVLDVVRGQTLDALVAQHDGSSVIQDMLQEAEQLERRANRFTRGRPAHGQKYQQRQEARELRQHSRMMERQIIGEVLAQAQIICSTVSFDFSVIEDFDFDLLVIDEACQSVEPGCWVPLRFANRLVLAGDHCQLPPTILSKEAAQEGYAISMMQRLVEHYGEQVTRQLTVQYRMHESIMEFSSARFYGGNLTADESVRKHVLSDLPRVTAAVLDEPAAMFIDSAGAGWAEEIEPDGLSKLNPQEGECVLQQVQALVDAGLSPKDIAVIAPYAAQVRWLRQRAEYNQLEIDTVDGFQGREKEAVVICTVRSNNQGEVGFLADARRMNVALTRARRKLILIGDSGTLGSNDFFTELLEWFEKSGTYRTVWELVEE